ncbi:MAG: zinc-binding dehydrogenase [Pseudonocardiaceae bacterium]|nr:zinc-binding dehydrogenase [Pseudonocardiaceae bacterium]
MARSASAKEQAADAHRLLEQGHVRGKLVLTLE